MKLLFGHTSSETAYVVADYPYGFRLRCKIRYWLEYKANKGFRFVSQTTNPKKFGLIDHGNGNVSRMEVWNKPKASTYTRFGGAMYLDENDHVQWSGLSEYSDGAEASAWKDKFGEAVPEAGRSAMNQWVAAKTAYDANRQKGDSLETGLVEAHKAWLDEAIKDV